MKPTFLLCGLWVMIFFSFPLYGIDRISVRDHLGDFAESTQVARTPGEYLIAGTIVTGDRYSLAPLVQDADSAFYSTESGGPTVHLFDEINESGGVNLLGSEGGFFVVAEEIVHIGTGLDRIVVKVTAVNAGSSPEPWVDWSKAGNGYTSWRLDVGSTAGGSNPIQPGVSFTVMDSGFDVYNSAGALLGSYDLTSDTSNAISLSGVAALGNSGLEIAGVDVSSIQIFWEISFDPSALIFLDGFE